MSAARVLIWAAVLGCALVPGTARSDTRTVEVRVDCEPAQGPQRVRCEVAIAPSPGARLAWADVLVASAPSFARPLRSRVVATTTEDGTARAAIALVATATGAEPLVVRGRGVVCVGEEHGAECRPETREARVEVRVGG